MNSSNLTAFEYFIESNGNYMGTEFLKHSTDGAKASSMTLPLQTSPDGANDHLLSYKPNGDSVQALD